MTPNPTSLSTLWLLPDGRVCARARGRTDAPSEAAHRLAAACTPAELQLIYRLFVNATDGTRYCIEAMLAHTRSCRLTGRRASIPARTLAILCRRYRVAIARLRAGLPAHRPDAAPAVHIPLARTRLDESRRAA